MTSIKVLSKVDEDNDQHVGVISSTCAASVLWGTFYYVFPESSTSSYDVCYK